MAEAEDGANIAAAVAAATAAEKAENIPALLTPLARQGEDSAPPPAEATPSPAEQTPPPTKEATPPPAGGEDLELEPDEDELPSDPPAPVSAAPAALAPEDEVWNGYKTEADRKKALFENQKYGREQAQKVRDLEAKLAAPPASTVVPPPATTEPARTPEQEIQATIVRLANEDPGFAQRVTSLDAHRTTIIEKRKTKIAAETALGGTQKSIGKIETLLEALREELAVTPNDVDVQERIERRERELFNLQRNEATQLRGLDGLDRELGELASTYTSTARELWEHANGVRSEERERAVSEETHQSSIQKTRETWKEEFPKLMTTLKVHTAEQGLAREYLLGLAAAADVPYDSLPDWLASQGQKLLTHLDAVRKAAIASVTAAARQDASIQAAPTGAAARVKDDREPGKRLSAKDAARLAAEGLNKDLAAAR